MSVERPPAAMWGFATYSFVNRVVAAGRRHDVTATSWWRSPSENARVGGDPFSQHLVGWAVDAVGPGSTAFAKQARLYGLTAVVESTHVHLQLFPPGILRRLAISSAPGPRHTI
jgi:hypothetical protein